MRVAVVGGTGFIGTYITEELIKACFQPRLLVRPGSEGKLTGATLETVTGALEDNQSLRRLLHGCDAVIYSVGILREDRAAGITFNRLQYEGVVAVRDAALESGVKRFILISANGVEAAKTPYQTTKLKAEQALAGCGLRTTIVRPSVVFGDPLGRMEFATQLYRDMVAAPMPAVAFHNGKRGPIEMSPIAVRDVASAVVRSLKDSTTYGETLELGGPEALRWSEMVQRIAEATNRRKVQIPVPVGIMRLAAAALDWLPAFPVTRDQLTMLAQGNVANCDALVSLIKRPPRRFDSHNLAYLKPS